MATFRIFSTYTQYFVDVREADSLEEAKQMIEDEDLDALAFDSAEFDVTKIEEVDE
jgi:predicted RNA-binding protein associated with RNAse of E/G family